MNDACGANSGARSAHGPVLALVVGCASWGFVMFEGRPLDGFKPPSRFRACRGDKALVVGNLRTNVVEVMPGQFHACDEGRCVSHSAGIHEEVVSQDAWDY